MDERTVLGADEKSEMRGLVLAGAARAESIRRRRARIATVVPAVLVVAGIVVGAGIASGMLGRGSVVPAAPERSNSMSASPSPEGETHPFNGIAAFDRPATATDALPDLPDYAKESLLAETARYIGEYDQVRYWIARGAEPGAICVTAWPTERADSWSTACGGVVLTTAKPGLFAARLGPTGSSPEGWIQLDENLSVNPNP
jgi:hypothetical protein